MVSLAVAAVAAACSPRPATTTSSGVPLAGPLIPATTTIVTAWDVPRNPIADASLAKSPDGRTVQWGYRLFTNTPSEAKQFAPGRMACAHCHLNAGQRERALPLVAVASVFPEQNVRAGRLYTLNDRIVDCFLRSENATGAAGPGDSAAQLPDTTSKEVEAIAAYITWLGRGVKTERNPPWRGQNTIPAGAVIPVDALDPRKGEAIYSERCVSCHGADGQGVALGNKKAGPLWGADSWNDGAGAARVYTLAGIVKYTMPYLNPGSLTDEEAQDVAAFINSKPRPSYPYKDRDYRNGRIPADAVYYPRH